MTTHRRYYFEKPGSWNHARVLSTLRYACESDTWYNEPIVGGDDTVLRFEFTASGRDQWWCHRRAMGLAARVFRALKKPETEVPIPVWESLAPHTNRGRWRTPAAS